MFMQRELVTSNDILDEEVTIHCTHRNTSSYLLAVVKIGIRCKVFLLQQPFRVHSLNLYCLVGCPRIDELCYGR